MLDLARLMGVKPYTIPRMLYQLQHNTNDNIAYDLDRESFIVQFYKIPSPKHVLQITEEMLTETRKVEKNLISKLNCMYFAARKVSVPNIEYMRKIEEEQAAIQPLKQLQ